MHVPADKRRKLDAKAVEVTFIGYESGSKGYRLWNKRTHSVHLSRDVTFDESSFPFFFFFFFFFLNPFMSGSATIYYTQYVNLPWAGKSLYKIK